MRKTITNVHGNDNIVISLSSIESKQRARSQLEEFAERNPSSGLHTMALLSAGVRQSPEDEFYTNLTLGLVKFLNSIQRITNITFNKQQPSERTQISTWEQRHNVYLADDMRRFYLSTDGFTLHWSYQYSRNAEHHIIFRSLFVTHVVFIVCSQ